MPDPSEITVLLEAYAGGDRGAFDQAVALIYPELRRVAQGQRRGRRPSATLDTTAIVHETYLKLIGASRAAIKNRGHFLAVAATAMRQVAVDYARSKHAAKRGGDHLQVELDDRAVTELRKMDEIIAVNKVLERMAREDPRLVRVVECRYFAGMTETETASTLDLSIRTVQRAWQTAKHSLRQGLAPPS